MPKQNAVTVSEPAGPEIPPVAGTSEETEKKLKLAVDFLRWLASAARADWDMRRRVIATLRAMGEWDE